MTHGAVNATLKLRERFPEEARADASFQVAISAAGIEIAGNTEPAKLHPSDTVDAQFSIYFQIAAAWVEGQLSWSTYDRLSDPAITSLIKRIKVTANNAVPNAGAIVAVKAGGRTESKKVIVPLGVPDNWIGDASLRHKFMLLPEPISGSEHAEGVADMVLHLTPEEPIRKVIKTWF